MNSHKEIVLDGELSLNIPMDGECGVITKVVEHDLRPVATQHTVLFEFTYETTHSITGYWDSSFISDAITATTPTSYGGKTVDSASLDGVEWYTRPAETWETLLDRDEVDFHPGETAPAYCWITELGDIYPTDGSIWRVTFDDVLYDNIIAETIITPWDGRERVIVGKAGLYGEGIDDTGEPFVFYNIGYGAWIGGVEGPNVASTHSIKVERLVTS